MSTSNTHTKTINRIANAIAPLASEYGVRQLTLFGSYARGEETQNSDIDLRIVDRGSLRGLFKLAAFQRELEEHLGKRVDLLPTDSLSNSFLDQIKDEEVTVYGFE